MSQSKNTFPFNSRDTYKDFSEDAKSKAIQMIEQIRQEKLAIKEQQRKTANASVSYVGINNLRQTIIEAEAFRAAAKVEASRQFVAQISA